MKILWKSKPDYHDYPAALDYLTLTMSLLTAGSFVEDLRAASTRQFKAKDILRASDLHPLSDLNRHVEKNIKKIKDGVELSPILLVRLGGKLVVADGYHRMCAVYHLDEDAEIPCKIVGP